MRLSSTSSVPLRFETRKIEIFRDGSIGFASGTESVAGTRLSDEPLPSITEIAADLSSNQSRDLSAGLRSAVEQALPEAMKLPD